MYGHSAHAVQGVEIYQGRPIIYSAGDFVDDYRVDPVLRNDWGILFRLTITGSQVQRVELVPVQIDQCQVHVARGAVQQAIAARVGQLSAELGTRVAYDQGRWWIDCAGAGAGEVGPARR